MDAHQLVEVLELVASDGRPGVLEGLVDVLAHSAAAVALAESWEVAPRELATTARRAVDLAQRLERKRLKPRDVEPGAMLWAVIDALSARSLRVGRNRAQRLERLTERLAAAAGVPGLAA